MKHIVSYGMVSESNSLIEVGIQFDCLSMERTYNGYGIQFVDHSYFYQGKDYVEVISTMLKEKEFVVSKGKFGNPLKVSIGGATVDSLYRVFGTNDIVDITKMLKAKELVNFEDGKADFLEMLQSIETNLLKQLETNNQIIKDEVSGNIMAWESVVEVEIAEDI
jgi:predicted nucleic-acid-binding protein